MKRIFYFIPVTLALVSCLCGCKQQAVDSPTALVAWVHDASNGLHVTREMGGLQLEVQHRPLDYIIAMENKGQPVSAAEASRRKAELEGMEYYNLSLELISSGEDIARSGTSSATDYQQRFQQLAFDMEHDVQLLQGTDTLPCLLFHYAPNYGVGPKAHFALAFERTASTEDRVLVFNDNIFNSGPIRFRMNYDSMADLPKIQYAS